MSTVLLRSKISIPLIRSEQVARPRLFERLNAGLKHKLTLVSAPAGFGKTTLISSWIKDKDLPTAWLSLDKDDNDPIRFCSYIIAAIQIIKASTAESLSIMLRSSPPPPLELILSGLINEFGGIHNRFILVLDDFHVIENKQVQDGVQFLLDHAPPTMHLVLSTRADPPWPMGRLRGSGEVTEIRSEDLRFTVEESTEFLNKIMGLDLMPEDVLALDTRTEGWIAGLLMSSLSMQGREDKSAFISTLTGSHRFILDYLVEEVLSRQPAEIQEFLVKTSTIDRMTADLCNALLKKDNSQSILKQLEETNLFLTPLDDERCWYRYHHLFADLLRIELQQRFPGQVLELHRRASQWFSAYGMIPEAVNHAFMSGDIEHVARLIEDNTLTIITVFNEQLPALVGWLEALPNDLLRRRPWLAVARAWVLAYSGELDAAEMVMREAEQIISKTTAEIAYENFSKETLGGYLAAIHGYCSFMEGDISCASKWIEKALQTLPKEDVATRVFCAVVLGASVGMLGDLEGGIRVLSDVTGLWQGAKSTILSIMVLCELAGLQILAGKLNQVVDTCKKAIHISEEYNRLMGVQPPNIGFAFSRLSYVLREKNDLETAIHYAQEAVKISRSWGQKDSLSMGYLYLALALQAAGKSNDASSTMLIARQVSSSLPQAIDANAAAYEAKFYSIQGESAIISQWAEKSGLSTNDEIPFNRAREYIVYARALMENGKLDESLAVLDRLLKVSETAQAMLFVIEILILQAMVLNLQGEPNQAVTLLKYALRIAEPEGYVRIFIDEGAKMEKLLRQAIRQGTSVPYVHQLLATLRAPVQPKDEKIPTTSSFPPSEWGDSLTRREIEILKLLMTSTSTDEIADELCIAVCTLRTHIRNIYDKLGVHSRMEAVAIARKMNLE